MASDIAGQIRVPDGNGKSSSILTECEQRRMLLSCSHPNVSTFSGSVSRTAAIFSANLSRDRAMFVSRRRYVLESLHLAGIPGSPEGPPLPSSAQQSRSPRHRDPWSRCRAPPRVDRPASPWPTLWPAPDPPHGAPPPPPQCRGHIGQSAPGPHGEPPCLRTWDRCRSSAAHTLAAGLPRGRPVAPAWLGA